MAIAVASGMSLKDVEKRLADEYAVAIGASFTHEDAPQALLDLNGKAIVQGFGLNAVAVANALPVDAVCADVKVLLEMLRDRTSC